MTCLLIQIFTKIPPPNWILVYAQNSKIIASNAEDKRHKKAIVENIPFALKYWND